MLRVAKLMNTFVCHLLGLLRLSPNEAKLSHRPFDLAYGDGTFDSVPAAKAESFRDKMLAKGHDLSARLRQLVQLELGLDIGIISVLILDIMKWRS